MTNTNTSTNVADRTDRHFTTETKASTKTTEFFVYVGVVLAIVIAAFVVGGDANNNNADAFSALDALRYITYLTIGYMIARGLAKAGSRANSDI